jgi:hypothetical protein
MDLIHGHESYAEIFEDSKHGKSIMLRPVNKLDAKRWVERQRNNKDEIDRIRKIDNKTFFIPEIRAVISYPEPSAFIEMAPGEKVTPEYFASLTMQQQDKIITATAHFLNVMHQSKPFEIVDAMKAGDLIHFDRGLKLFAPLLSKDSVEKIQLIQSELEKEDFKILTVWAHADFWGGNIFYDVTTDTVSYIDFGEARYVDFYKEIYANEALKKIIGDKKYEEFIEIYLRLPKQNPIPFDVTKDRERYTYIKDDIGWRLSTLYDFFKDMEKSLSGIDKHSNFKAGAANIAGRIGPSLYQPVAENMIPEHNNC